EGRHDVGLSVGIAAAAGAPVTGSELLRRADMAMYAAKQSPDHFQLYEGDVAEPAEARVPLNVVPLRRAQRERAEIRSLLEDSNALRIVFQPIVDLSTGRVAGHEAL